MRSKSTLLTIALCGVCLACDDSGMSFQEFCDRLVAEKCWKEVGCGPTPTMDDCLAQGKALYCSGGPKQYCGAGGTYQSGKVGACLNAILALDTCSTLMPTACKPEMLCTSSSQASEALTSSE
jgi:hypothetical protein